MSVATERLVLVEKRGPVGIATLNRPEKHNAMSSALSQQLVDAIDAFEADDEIAVIVVTGAGERAFSAGGDMTEVRDRMGPNGRSGGGPNTSERVRTCAKPVIAAIRGICYGGAAHLAVNCDIRICGDDTRFRFVAAQYGMPACGAILPRIVGDAKAKEILMTADIVYADEALRSGLANQVVPAAEVLDTAVAMGARIAANSQIAVQALKRIIDAALPIDDAMALEQALGKAARESTDSEQRFRAAATRVTGTA
ncbi:MAG: enoyl-CoA hydratase/isomerase family protein [Chloroflexi bacterium]|nr:enoyl-CoA hydratase/isomerase family protein [Chloroflexota bacterium]